MTKHLVTALVLCAFGGRGVARAGGSKAEQLGSDVESYANLEANVGSYTDYDSIKRMRTENKCAALVARAVKAGGEAVAWRLGDHPKAEKRGDKFAVKVADLGWFCERYANRLDDIEMTILIQAGKDAERDLAHGFDDQRKKDMSGDGAKAYQDNSARCPVLVSAMVARGVAADATLKSAKNEPVPFASAQAACAALTKWSDAYQVEWKQQFEVLSKPFAAAGIKGPRLDLLVYYHDMEFYLPGCKSSTAEPKKLKSAKALFQWLTDGNDVITIRKYAFKGDAYTIIEKQFLTEAAAYKGCK
jgi:hypothetical protein